MNVNALMTQYDTLAEIFKALAHPVRLQILEMLLTGEVCVCHIEAALGKRQAYISQQLMALREAGVVESQKQGLQVYYRLATPQIVTLLTTVFPFNPDDATQGIPGCPCPNCATIAIQTIS